MGKDRDIKGLIQDIARGARLSDSYITAEVVSIDGDTCTVSFDNLQFTDVMLTPLIDEDKNKLLITPKVGSVVLIADLSNGDKRDLQVISCSVIESISVNGGELGGLVKINDLTEKLNALTDKMNALVDTFNSHTHTVNTTGTAAAQTGTALATIKKAAKADSFSSDDYEDKSIKH